MQTCSTKTLKLPPASDTEFNMAELGLLIPCACMCPSVCSSMGVVHSNGAVMPLL